MKKEKMPFMGGTIVAVAIIIVLIVVSKFSDGSTDKQVINVEPTERPTMEFLKNTEIINVPTEENYQK